MSQKAIGILTSGGDCPGLNAAIRGVGKAVRGAFDNQIIGFRDGFRGLVENRVVRLENAALSGILTLGGTILGTSRDKPHAMPVGGRTMNMIDVAVAPLLSEPSVPLSNSDLMDVAFQKVQPIVEGQVRLGLADQDKAEPLLQEEFTERLVAVEIIAQYSDLGCSAEPAIATNQAFSCRELTILLVRSVLRGHKLGF